MLARGFDRTIRPVYWPVTSTFSRKIQSFLLGLGRAVPPGAAVIRSSENLTSSAVISPKPSENICAGFSVNSMTVGLTCLTSDAASSSISTEFGFCFISRWNTARHTLPSHGPVRKCGSTLASSRSILTVIEVFAAPCAPAGLASVVMPAPSVAAMKDRRSICIGIAGILGEGMAGTAHEVRP